jgi:ribosomal protein S12 methylthiotransferase
MKNVHLRSLGCPKNRVDSEIMVAKLTDGPFRLVDEASEADVIVVNTCSFIEPATNESIDTILELAKHKSDGACEKLVVTGCMVQRYGESLESEFPEVDNFLGTGDYHRIETVLTKPGPRSIISPPEAAQSEGVARVTSTSPGSAYIKISEGCDHRCAFCIIPQLRGRLRSRSIASLVSEAERLVAQGIVEINLVSQDSTAYGRDRDDDAGLGPLMRALAAVEGIQWIRLHYAYPIGLPKGLLEAMAELPQVVSYLDMPLQHASGPILKAMRRGVTRTGTERILDRVRGAVPNVALRTTFIVGFPGETEEDFEELVDFVRCQRFDHVGVFAYSSETGTPAADLVDDVPSEVKQDRIARLMAIQAAISEERLERFVGMTVPVLITGPSEESEWLLEGRTPWQAPDVDGIVYVSTDNPSIRPGCIYPVYITDSGEHDLAGEIVVES